jgi:hypothetical protein
MLSNNEPQNTGITEDFVRHHFSLASVLSDCVFQFASAVILAACFCMHKQCTDLWQYRPANLCSQNSGSKRLLLVVDHQIPLATVSLAS